MCFSIKSSIHKLIRSGLMIECRLNNHVHIGVAVAVPDGLLVPVVKFANEQSLPQIGAAVKELLVKLEIKKLRLEKWKVVLLPFLT